MQLDLFAEITFLLLLLFVVFYETYPGEVQNN